MKRITITSILALCMACPSFADIGKNEQNPTCNDTTIGATSGSTSLEAQWTANTITLDYYSGDTKLSTGSCSYDGGITLPSDPTPPTGYEFSGWKMRRAAAQQSEFDLTALDVNKNWTGNAYRRVENMCYRQYTTDGKNAASSGECSQANDEEFNDLGTNEYKVEFEYGMIYGVAKCSTKGGDNHSSQWGGNADDWTATNEELVYGADATLYCWCKLTAFKNNQDENYIPVNMSKYVFLRERSMCDNLCISLCQTTLEKNSAFRSALFDVSVQ